MDIGSAIDRYEEEIVKHIRELIAIRSVAEASQPGKPFGGGVDDALKYMLDLGAKLGFRTNNVDGYAGHVEFGSGDKLAGILVHIDTVAEGDGWTTDPLGGELSGGRLYGRGAFDNKGPAIVALYALKAFADTGLEADGRLRVIIGTNEENGMTDMDYYFAREPVPDESFSPDAAYPIIHAEKACYVLKLKTKEEQPAIQDEVEGCRLIELRGGTAPNLVPDRCEALVRAEGKDAEELLQAAESREGLSAEQTTEGWIRLTATGKSGHGSYPPSGVNAIAGMAAFLAERLNGGGREAAYVAFLNERLGFQAFGQSLGIACEDPVHGRLTVNLAEAGITDGQMEVTLNVRVPVTFDGEEVLVRLRKLLDTHGIELTVAAHLPPLYVPEEHPLIRKLSRAYETSTGEKARLLSIGGGTYARKLQGKGVAFGSGFPGGPDNRAHQPDEFVVVEDLMKHGRICTQAIYELIGSRGE